MAWFSRPILRSFISHKKMKTVISLENIRQMQREFGPMVQALVWNMSFPNVWHQTQLEASYKHV